MKRKVSEFSYGFALTHELIYSYGYLPTSGFTQTGEEVKKGIPLFLQFKASEYMKRRNAGDSKLVGLPYFRFPIHRKSQSNQHQLLIELEKKGNAVFYATPKIHEAVNLNSAFFDRKLVTQSLFIPPGEIGEIEDNESHRVVFGGRTDDVYFLPPPKKLEGAISGESFEQSVGGYLNGMKPEMMDDECFHSLSSALVSLVSPNRRIFDELSRGRFEMGAATFANYLAKTLFDCELLIIPRI